MVSSSQLAAEISSKILEILEQRKTETIQEIEGVVARNLLKMAWSHIMKIIPKIINWAVQLLSQRYGSMTINDLIATLENIRKNSEVKLY